MRDDAFARELFAATIATDVALLPEPLRGMLLDQQYEAWVRSLEGHAEREDVVLLDDAGASIGRLVLARSPGVLTVVDIGLVPSGRNRGRGERVMRAIFAQAASEGRVVRGHTRVTNPARRLYDRLGMKVTAEDALHVEYTYTP